MIGFPAANRSIVLIERVEGLFAEAREATPHFAGQATAEMGVEVTRTVETIVTTGEAATYAYPQYRVVGKP